MSKRVLFIEDDSFFVQAYEAALSKAGFDVSHVIQGEEGVQCAIADLPDAIFLDIALPKKNGFEILQLLVEDERTKNIPVIMFSNLGTKEDIDRCFRLGARNYLVKGHHSPEDVCRSVEEMLQTDGMT